MPIVVWSAALAAILLILLTGAVAWALQRRRRHRPAPLPSEWALSARPVFNTDERRVYRLLREALPHHVLLSKLPLVRFCQPDDPNEVHYWYGLLGAAHVTFAICSANGRVLAAIDLDNERGNSRRVMQIKQSVLAACRVRYLRCAVDNLPSVAELQLLVPHTGAAVRAPHPAPAGPAPSLQRHARSRAGARRSENAALWQDSAFFHDSFFAPDSRMDGYASPDTTGPSASGSGRGMRPGAAADSFPKIGTLADAQDDIAGIVVDTPPRNGPPIRH